MKKLINKIIVYFFERGYKESGVAAEFSYLENVITTQLDLKLRTIEKRAKQEYDDKITKALFRIEKELVQEICASILIHNTIGRIENGDTQKEGLSDGQESLSKSDSVGSTPNKPA